MWISYFFLNLVYLSIWEKVRTSNCEDALLHALKYYRPIYMKIMIFIFRMFCAESYPLIFPYKTLKKSKECVYFFCSHLDRTTKITNFQGDTLYFYSFIKLLYLPSITTFNISYHIKVLYVISEPEMCYLYAVCLFIHSFIHSKINPGWFFFLSFLFF